jgi:excisionase family DNA binding protein
MKTTFFDWEKVPIIMTVDDLASLLNISRSAAYSLCNSKGFPTSHIGSRLVVEKDNLRKWLARNTTP